MTLQALSDWILVSKIPQFIEDLNHPWIKENKQWLEQRSNPIRDLCDLDSPLRNGNEDGYALPSDLFHRLEIDNNRCGIERSGWGNALQRLREIKNCPAALHDVRHLHVDVYLKEGEYGDDDDPEPIEPGTEISQLFVDVLRSMPNLRRLDWGIPPESTPFLGECFTREKLTLPSINHLVLGPFSEYLVPLCPNLAELQAGDYTDHWGWSKISSTDDDEDPDPYQRLIQSTSSAVNITTLSFNSGDNGWTPQVVQDIRVAMPNIVRLKMYGYIQSQHRASSEPAEPGEKLKSVLMELKSFDNLIHLQLPDARYLGVGFKGGHWCGNAYMGVNGRKYGREVSRQKAKAMELATAIILDTLPHLKSLIIDFEEPSIFEADDGQLTVSWPWTDRMEEWLFEIWPEPSSETLEKGNRFQVESVDRSQT